MLRVLGVILALAPSTQDLVPPTSSLISILRTGGALRGPGSQEVFRLLGHRAT